MRPLPGEHYRAKKGLCKTPFEGIIPINSTSTFAKRKNATRTA